MLADTLFRVPREAGLHVLQKRGAGIARELSSWRLIVEPGQRQTFHVRGEETVVVLQEGAGRFAVGDRSWPVSRKGVFEERATALYLPAGAELAVEADTRLEAVLIATPAEPGGEATLVGPDDVKVSARGRGDYTREIHDIFVHDRIARRLLVGETFNPPGKWSSFPPHKHDGSDGEPRLEEVYHFRVDPPQGFGTQILYTPAGESFAHAVRDGDTVVLPYGYHPVAAAPGYRLCYLWALSGEQRKLVVFEDPDHVWLHKTAE